MRNPSTPRLNQNRRMSANSVCTCGLVQFRSGCRELYRCRNHCPSGTCVHADPPKRDCQLLGGPPSTPSRNQNRSRSGDPGPAATAALNHGCSSEQWFGTMSMMIRMPRSWASSISFSASASDPKDGSMSR
jgi:hypothetical protein